jgi:hypothetical protein
MPLDPNIALQVGQPVQPIDPLKAYGQVLTLKNLMDQQRMQSMQMEKAQREESDLQGVRRAYTVRPDGTIDEQATTRNLVTGGYGPQAVDFRHKSAVDKSALMKAEREAEKAKFETLGKRIELVGQVLGSLPENPTYEQAVQASRFLNKEGVRHDENDIPKDPALLPDYIRRERMRALTNKEQFEQNRPKSTFGQLLADSEDWEQRTRRLMDTREPNIDPSNVGQGGQIQAPKVIVDLPPNPYLPAIKMAQGRDPNKPFGFNERGQPVANTAYQDYTLRNSKAGASNVNVGVQAYDKELNKQDAQAVSDARKGAEQAASAASDARAITQILKGQNGGNWTTMQAALGGWLPGTPYANVTSVVTLAESIRARAAPAMRVPGSGATSDFESKQLLGIFPQLLQSDDGRELAARVLERVAERQAIAADIKDQMVRSGKYSVKKFNDAVRAEFGDGLLTPDEKKLMERLQGAGRTPGGRTPSAPTFDINGLPDPAKNSGKVIESEKGVRLRSDGKKWVPMQ